MDATDPTAVEITDEEFVLNIIVPEMQMFFRLATGEAAPFNEALKFALQRHSKYWSKASRRKDPNGYVALGPLAMSVMAQNTRMAVEVEFRVRPASRARRLLR